MDSSDRVDAALADLEALEEQRRAGLLDDTTAARLWARYAREALAHAEVRDGEAATGTGDTAPTAHPDGAGRGGTGGGWTWRIGLLTLAAAAVAALTVSISTTDRAPGGFVTGNEATAPAAGRDPSQVTNEELEEIVAQNPDVVAMRARLAHRYMDVGEFDRAVDHYLQVLERGYQPESMAHLGWILFGQGSVEVAEPLLEESRRLDPLEPEAMWFHANLLLYGRDDPAAATRLLEALLRRDDLAGASRSAVEAALDDARGRSEDGR